MSRAFILLPTLYGTLVCLNLNKHDFSRTCVTGGQKKGLYFPTVQSSVRSALIFETSLIRLGVSLFFPREGPFPSLFTFTIWPNSINFPFENYYYLELL